IKSQGSPEGAVPVVNDQETPRYCRKGHQCRDQQTGLSRTDAAGQQIRYGGKCSPEKCQRRMRYQVGVSKDPEYQGDRVVRAWGEERKEIAVEHLPVENPLRTL